MYSVTTPVMEVSVESGGSPLRIYHRDDYRLAGEPGAAYAVRVRNLTSGRIEVLLSVDGRNTLKDEDAGFGNAGMVIPEYEAYSFPGWRLDSEGARDFLFGAIGDSVAAQAGDASNAGVIGIAAWQEKIRIPLGNSWNLPDYEYRQSIRGYATDVFYSSSRGMPVIASIPVAGAAAGMDAGMGTGIGGYRTDKVGITTFQRGEGPDIAVIRYASYESLKRAGIIQPDPFPAKTGHARYRSPGQ